MRAAAALGMCSTIRDIRRSDDEMISLDTKLFRDSGFCGIGLAPEQITNGLALNARQHRVIFDRSVSLTENGFDVLPVDGGHV